MRKDRLLKLADFLETVPPKAFDLASWQTSAPTKPEGERQGECGFAGCAIGWATHAKLFRGLKFGELACNDTPHLHYYGARNWTAVEKLFGFEPNAWCAEDRDAYHLFDADYYSGAATPKQVAKRIRKFVSEKSPQRRLSGYYPHMVG